ncbi:MAG: 2-C-methyl-D-erythritol 4-phosphate cytidylyltransferase [Actinomycetota bacterium]
MRRGRGREDARRGPRITGSVAGIVAAGGQGRRAGFLGPAEPPKQFRPLGGLPLIGWSVRLLTDAGCDPVVVVVPEGSWTDRLSGFEVRVVLGGDERQKSVRNGLSVVDTPSVVVHDAARPFATPALVRDVLAALKDAHGAAPAVPVADTLKEVRDGRVIRTVERSSLWAIQTPQAFRTDALKTVHDKARVDGFVASDDGQLIERYGGVMRIVEGTRDNIKLTFPEDWRVAEAMVAARGGGDRHDRGGDAGGPRPRAAGAPDEAVWHEPRRGGPGPRGV